MHIEPHDLQHEFPEFVEILDALKNANSYFAELFARYNRLTGKVEGLEEHDMPIADFTLEDMKKQRVKLKDEIHHLLLAFQAGQKYNGG